MKLLLRELRLNRLLWLLAFVPVVFIAAKVRPDAHRLARHEQRALRVVRRRAGADGLPDLRHDALPLTARRLHYTAMIQTVVFDTKPYDREPLQRASAGLDIEWRFMDCRLT